MHLQRLPQRRHGLLYLFASKLACDGVQSAEGTWTHASRGRRWKEGNKRSSKADSGNHSSLWRQHGKVFCSRHAPLLDGHPCNQPLQKPEFAKSLQNQPVILNSSIFPAKMVEFRDVFHDFGRSFSPNNQCSFQNRVVVR